MHLKTLLIIGVIRICLCIWGKYAPFRVCPHWAPVRVLMRRHPCGGNTKDVTAMAIQNMSSKQEICCGIIRALKIKFAPTRLPWKSKYLLGQFPQLLERNRFKLADCIALLTAGVLPPFLIKCGGPNFLSNSTQTPGKASGIYPSPWCISPGMTYTKTLALKFYPHQLSYV